MKSEGIKEVRSGYFVSTDGRVYSEKYGRRVELRQSEHKGYRRVCFSHENKRQHYPVHRLVAEAWIPNPDNKPFVNHKDGNKRNNIVSNLDWVTASENQRHAYGELNIRNGHTGYRYAKLYPNEELRSRLVELAVPRWKHNLAELGEMLPREIGYKSSTKEVTGYDGYRSMNFECGKTIIDAGWYCMYSDPHPANRVPVYSTHAVTEADARAKMLIYLIENNLITV